MKQYYIALLDKDGEILEEETVSTAAQAGEALGRLNLHAHKYPDCHTCGDLKEIESVEDDAVPVPCPDCTHLLDPLGEDETPER